MPIPDSTWKSLFAPESVVVVGASNRLGSWGERITSNLIAPGIRKVYAVNPGETEVRGLHSYKSVLDIDEPVELGVIVVRAELVARTMREFVEKKIKAALIISGGFGESDEAGAELEKEVTEIARSGGIRFIGPNTMGHLETYSQLNTLSFVDKINSGPLALIAQSGNMGTRIMHNTSQYGVGINRFVCCGNETDIKLEDYLDYFSRDPGTKIIMLYIEGLRDARRFFKLAKEITKTKPIVVMKAGGTENAARASRSHTGALAGSEAVYSAAFRQAGVIRVGDDEELLDITIALLNQPLPRGNRVGVLTIGGGLGVVTAEACEREGLDLADLEQISLEKLDELLPARWSHGNPVDLVGSSLAHSPEMASTLWILMEDNNLDAIISNAWIGRTDRRRSSDSGQAEDSMRSLRDEVKKYGKPFFMVGSPPQQVSELEAYNLYRRGGFSVFPQPARAARTLGRLNWYRQYLEGVGGK